jgi:hypothetical protein
VGKWIEDSVLIYSKPETTQLICSRIGVHTDLHTHTHTFTLLINKAGSKGSNKRETVVLGHKLRERLLCVDSFCIGT